jgi:hypothetical protein
MLRLMISRMISLHHLVPRKGAGAILKRALVLGETEVYRPGHFIVGIVNSAPSLVPDGQREVTVLVLV